MATFGKNLINARKIVEIFQHYKIDFQTLNNEYWAPIHVAVKKGCFDAIETLIKLGKSLSSQDLEQSYKSSRYSSREPVIQVGLIDINAPGGKERLTPLHLATMGSYYRIVNFLIDHGADQFARNSYGKNPFTAINNNLLMIKMLKKAQLTQTRRLFEITALKVHELQLVDKPLIRTILGRYINDAKVDHKLKRLSFMESYKILRHYI